MHVVTAIWSDMDDMINSLKSFRESRWLECEKEAGYISLWGGVVETKVKGEIITKIKCTRFKSVTVSVKENTHYSPVTDPRVYKHTGEFIYKSGHYPTLVSPLIVFHVNIFWSQDTQLSMCLTVITLYYSSVHLSSLPNCAAWFLRRELWTCF